MIRLKVLRSFEFVPIKITSWTFFALCPHKMGGSQIATDD